MYRNRKGFLSQNCLFACNFALEFIFTLTGIEGSATDAKVWDFALQRTSFKLPYGKYFLGDGGYPSCAWILIPYREVRYHLAEWGRAAVRYIVSYPKLNSQITFSIFRPESKEELFNLRHAQLRNTIERIFGVLKQRYRILLLPAKYDLLVQSQIPVALAAIHNFIVLHEPYNQPEADSEDLTGHERRGDPLDPDHRASSLVAELEGEEGDERRDAIATAMWRDYAARRRAMGIPVAGDDGMESGDDDIMLEDEGFEPVVGFL